MQKKYLLLLVKDILCILKYCHKYMYNIFLIHILLVLYLELCNEAHCVEVWYGSLRACFMEYLEKLKEESKMIWKSMQLKKVNQKDNDCPLLVLY